MGRSKTPLIAVIPDTHAPHTDPVKWENILSHLDHRRGKITHLVHIGDWLDLSVFGGYSTEDKHGQEEEYAYAAKQARDLRKAVGSGCELFRLDGNHEFRIRANRINLDPRLRGMVGIEAHPGLSREWRDWQAVPYCLSKEGTLRLGPVLLAHGFKSNTRSDNVECIQIASLHGYPTNCLVVRGHTHRPLLPTQATASAGIPLPYWYANTGHIGPEKPLYTHNQFTGQWGSHLLLVSVSTLGVSRAYSRSDWGVEALPV